MNEQDTQVLMSLNANKAIRLQLTSRSRAVRYRVHLRKMLNKMGYSVDLVSTAVSENYCYVWFIKDFYYQVRLDTEMRERCQVNTLDLKPTPTQIRMELASSNSKGRKGPDLTPDQRAWLERQRQRAEGTLLDDPEDVFPLV